MQMPDGASPELRAALHAADRAAEVIRRHYGTRLDVKTKADASPVTQADVESEQVIREVLSEAFPAYSIYGEEGGRDARGGEHLWLVDPIDGTKSFIRGYPFFSTQIALMHRDRIVLGVSSAPAFGELAWAERGRGSYLDGHRIAVSDVTAIGACALSTGNLASLAGSSAWAAFGSVVAEVDRIRGYGDFYHYHLLARGAIDAVLESDLNLLDIAALSVIVEEAGGRFTDLEGRPIGLATRSVLAANPALHAALMERLSF